MSFTRSSEGECGGVRAHDAAFCCPHHAALRPARQGSHPRHLEFPSRYDRARAILAADPYNRGRAYQIKKLEGVQEARWRLPLGRFRFRYDIEGQEVILHYCGLRREDTYD